jgi:hypothetical protein
MMTLTHTSRNDQDDVRNVYRDRETGIAVTHTSAYRGGCLYLGTVTVLNQNTAASFTFISTATPGEISEVAAAEYAAKHADKIGA